MRTVSRESIARPVRAMGSPARPALALDQMPELGVVWAELKASGDADAPVRPARVTHAGKSFASERREFLVERFAYWDKWAVDGRKTFRANEHE
jgi:hypothetical protein